MNTFILLQQKKPLPLPHRLNGPSDTATLDLYRNQSHLEACRFPLLVMLKTKLWIFVVKRQLHKTPEFNFHRIVFQLPLEKNRTKFLHSLKLCRRQLVFKQFLSTKLWATVVQKQLKIEVVQILYQNQGPLTASHFPSLIMLKTKWWIFLGQKSEVKDTRKFLSVLPF